MHPIFAEFIDRLEALHKNFQQAIANLPPEAFDWVPGVEMNSIGVLVVHTAGAERHWIVTIAGNDPQPRNRPDEFKTEGINGSTLSALLDAVFAHSKATLEKLTVDDLALERTDPRDGKTYTAAWAILHALEHTASHVGHVQVTRQLWDQKS